MSHLIWCVVYMFPWQRDDIMHIVHEHDAYNVNSIDSFIMQIYKQHSAKYQQKHDKW